LGYRFATNDIYQKIWDLAIKLRRGLQDARGWKKEKWTGTGNHSKSVKTEGEAAEE